MWFTIEWSSFLSGNILLEVPIILWTIQTFSPSFVEMSYNGSVM